MLSNEPKNFKLRADQCALLSLKGFMIFLWRNLPSFPALDSKAAIRVPQGKISNSSTAVVLWPSLSAPRNHSLQLICILYLDFATLHSSVSWLTNSERLEYIEIFQKLCVIVFPIDLKAWNLMMLYRVYWMSRVVGPEQTFLVPIVFDIHYWPARSVPRLFAGYTDDYRLCLKVRKYVSKGQFNSKIGVFETWRNWMQKNSCLLTNGRLDATLIMTTVMKGDCQWDLPFYVSIQLCLDENCKMRPRSALKALYKWKNNMLHNEN